MQNASKNIQKINNQLNNCNITNINIVQLGNEEINNLFTKKDKLNILSKGYMAINEIIKQVHFNPKYPQFQNIIITNLKDEYGYKYDDIHKKFIACTKDELINDLIDCRVIDLDDFLNENEETLKKQYPRIIKPLNDLIKKLTDEDALFEKKKSEIKLLIYNSSNKNIINN